MTTTTSLVTASDDDDAKSEPGDAITDAPVMAAPSPHTWNQSWELAKAHEKSNLLCDIGRLSSVAGEASASFTGASPTELVVLRILASAVFWLMPQNELYSYDVPPPPRTAALAPIVVRRGPSDLHDDDLFRLRSHRDDEC